MLTVFRLVSDGVAGSGWCALSLLACALLRLAVGLLLPGGCRVVLRSFLIPALFCDLCWYAVFYPVPSRVMRKIVCRLRLNVKSASNRDVFQSRL